MFENDIFSIYVGNNENLGNNPTGLPGESRILLPSTVKLLNSSKARLYSWCVANEALLIE